MHQLKPTKLTMNMQNSKCKIQNSTWHRTTVNVKCNCKTEFASDYLLRALKRQALSAADSYNCVNT